MSLVLLHQNIETGTAQEITGLVSAMSCKTKRAGSPGQLDFTLVEMPSAPVGMGDIIALKDDETGYFYGYVFSVSRSEKGEVQVTAYDQLRYLKAKDTYVFTGKRADEMAALIAADFGLKTGELANTGYVIPTLTKDNKTLFDIILTALDLTLINTGKMFVLWDDFGALRLTNAAENALNLVVGDKSLATGYTYKQDIDSDSFNQIKLVQDNAESGKRDVFVVKDSDNIKRWGTLQYFDKASGLNAAQMEAQADSLLALKNRPMVSFEMKALLNPVVRAGRALRVQLETLGLDGWYIIDECTQDFVKETMNLRMMVL